MKLPNLLPYSGYLAAAMLGISAFREYGTVAGLIVASLGVTQWRIIEMLITLAQQNRIHFNLLATVGRSHVEALARLDSLENDKP